MEKVRIAIIGCGLISKFHITAIRLIPQAELAGVCGCDAEESRRAAKTYETKAYLSREEIWADPAVDAVCICTPSGLQEEQAYEAVDHGKHVLIEKPMALRVEGCNRIIARAKENQVLVGVVSQLRFSPEILFVKNIIAQGRLGRMVSADLYLKYYRSQDYYDASPWRGTKDMDGGALMNQGIHGVDLLQYLVGMPKEIYARAATRIHQMEAEDLICGVMEFPDGSMGVMEATTGAYPGFSRRIELHGEKGSVILEEDKIAFWNIQGCEPPIPPHEANANDYGKSDPGAIDPRGHVRQISNFIQAILGNEALLNDGEEGKKAVSIILAAYESAEKKIPVAL